MGFINHKKADSIRDVLENTVPESFVGKTHRRYEKNVDLITNQPLLNGVPLVCIREVDRFGPDSDPFRCHDLIPHQGEQRRHQQCEALPLVP